MGKEREGEKRKKTNREGRGEKKETNIGDRRQTEYHRKYKNDSYSFPRFVSNIVSIRRFLPSALNAVFVNLVPMLPNLEQSIVLNVILEHMHLTLVQLSVILVLLEAVMSRYAVVE